MLYKGFEVITAMPNQRDGRPLVLDSGAIPQDSGTGIPSQDKMWNSPIGGSSDLWFLDSRALINEYLTQVRSFRGKQVPFWIPTWHRDMAIVSASEGNSTFDIESRDYASSLFSTTDYSRRHLGILTNGGTTLTIRGITDAEDNGDGTETISLTANLPGGLDYSMFCFLLFCRLASDDVEMVWWGHDLAESSFTTVELPREAPAP